MKGGVDAVDGLVGMRGTGGTSQTEAPVSVVPADRTSPSGPPPLGPIAERARSGHHREALLALEGLGGAESGDPAALDLLARLHAQRGRLAEADACWTRAREAALAAEPPRPDLAAAAAAGRRRVAALQAGHYRPSGRRRVAVALLACAATGAVAAGALLPAEPERQPRDPSVGRDLSSVRERLDELKGALDDAVADPDPNLGQAARQRAAALGGPGTTVTRRGGSYLITFDEGLFTRDALLTGPGRGALADLGRRLRPVLAEGAPVVVTGHTDDLPLRPGSPYADRVNLGYVRAEVAAAELARAAGLPATGSGSGSGSGSRPGGGTIGISSTGTAEPPFPNDSAAGRTRNNTVTVLVGPPDPAEATGRVRGRG